MMPIPAVGYQKVKWDYVSVIMIGICLT